MIQTERAKNAIYLFKVPMKWKIGVEFYVLV